MGFLCLLLFIAFITVLIALVKRNKEVSEYKNKEFASKTIEELISKVNAYENTIKEHKLKEIALKNVEELNEHIQKLEATIASYKDKVTALKTLSELREEIKDADKYLTTLHKSVEIIEVGFYAERYSFDTSEKYKLKLDEVRNKQKTLINEEKAITTRVNLSGKENKDTEKMIKSIMKLALRAFNGECDTIIAKVKFGNVMSYEDKIRKSKDAINKLCEKWYITITDEYCELMIEELRLVYEYEEKREHEREEQRLIKEQMREEEKALREIEKAKQDAEKEEQRYQDALDKARKEMEGKKGKELDELNEKIRLLEQQFIDAHNRKERAISQAQLTKSGHVYVISNIGSFGENVFKIGMTRRLEPLERVKELGDASVPFEFDVHAVIYSDNAPDMETQLHKIFHKRRVNLVNEKREFFNVSINEIVDALQSIDPKKKDVEIKLMAEAKEYYQTVSMRESMN